MQGSPYIITPARMLAFEIAVTLENIFETTVFLYNDEVVVTKYTYHKKISFTSFLNNKFHKLSTCIMNSENEAGPITQTMEIPASLPLSNNTILAITEMDQFIQKMDQFIPKELQMPVGIAVCQPLDCVCRQFV